MVKYEKLWYLLHINFMSCPIVNPIFHAVFLNLTEVTEQNNDKVVLEEILVAYSWSSSSKY